MNDEFVRKGRLKGSLDELDVGSFLLPLHLGRFTASIIGRWRDVESGRGGGRVCRRGEESGRVSPVVARVEDRAGRLEGMGRLDELLGGVVLGVIGAAVEVGVAILVGLFVSTENAVADDCANDEYSGNDDGDESGRGDSLGGGSGRGGTGR